MRSCVNRITAVTSFITSTGGRGPRLTGSSHCDSFRDQLAIAYPAFGHALGVRPGRVTSRGGWRCRFHSRRKIPAPVQCSTPRERPVSPKARCTGVPRTTSTPLSGPYRPRDPRSQQLLLLRGSHNIWWIRGTRRRVVIESYLLKFSRVTDSSLGQSALRKFRFRAQRSTVLSCRFQ